MLPKDLRLRQKYKTFLSFCDRDIETDPAKMRPFSALGQKQNFERISCNEEVTEIFVPRQTFFLFVA
jgi:hypothetical protein